MAPKHIQEEANYYLKKAISWSPNHSLAVDEFIEILEDLKKSAIQRNKDVFSCIMSELFDEWTFFPGHSRSALMRYANVFGSVIEHGLISNPNTLNNALRFILVALNSKPKSKMFDFGITALNQFHERFGDSGFVGSLSAIPHLKCFPQHLIERIKDSKQLIIANTSAAHVYHEDLHVAGSSRPQSSVSSSATTAPVADSPTVLSGTAPGDIESVELEAFDFETVSRCPTDKEKMVFIVNNLSENNINEKCAEIKKILRDEHVGWLSEYLIEKRVSFEINLHALYSDLLDKIANENLNSLVMSTTVENIRALLESDNMSNKPLLSNLGHWLGVITLAKNKPLPFTPGYLKSLLMEARSTQRSEKLEYIVPFVAKILLSSVKSKVFGPKSSRTLNILRSLVELHNLPGLKLKLQFEVEVLFKSLNIQLTDFKSAQY